MTRRVALNLGLFVLLGLFLVWKVATEVIGINFFNSPYELGAEFESSPGLQPGFEAAYLGTSIGDVSEVKLADGKVSVKLSIDHDKVVPEGSSATVRRKSAVGEPYVDFSPPENYEAGVTPLMEDGDVVPLERTHVPLSYAELFDALDDLVSAIPEDDLATVFRELAIALDGNTETIRQFLVNSQDVVETFSENRQVLIDSTESFANLTEVLADHRDALGQTFDDMAGFSATMAASADDLRTVLEEGGTLAEQVSSIVADSKGDLACALGSLSIVVERVGRDDLVDALRRVLVTGAPARDAFRDITVVEDDGPWIRAIPPINAGDEDTAAVYPEPHELPPVAAVPDCGGLAAATAPGTDAVVGGSPGGADGSAASPGVDPGPDPDDADENLASSDQETSGGGFDPLMILSLLAIIALIAATRPWRIIGRLRS